MGKKFYLGILDKLSKIFVDQKTVLQTIEQLKLEIENADNLVFKNDKVADKNKFELPSEVTSDSECIALFSDGACRGNPGPGAWAALAQDYQGNILFESTSVEMLTTNNRMELEAVIQGLQLLRTDHSKHKIHVYSDSKYVVEGAGQWMIGWKKRGWLKSDNRPPENVELWKSLDLQMDSFANVSWHWVRGHSGHPQNEYCDQMANKILNESGY